jgi:formate dehydrogenase accessory protein FdhD
MKKFGTAVMLAGGQSTRMGFDKQTLCVDGIRLTDLILRQLSEIFEDLIVVTGRPELYTGRPVRLISDPWSGVGPLAGLYAGLKASKSDYVYLMACDMPEFSPAYANYLMQVIEDEAAAVTRFKEWIEPFHGFYHVSLADRIETFVSNGQRNIYQFLSHEHVLYIDESKARQFSPDWKLFDNLNTPKHIESVLNVNSTREDTPMKQKCPMLRYEKGTWQTYEDEVVREYTLHLHVNGDSWAKLLCSPKGLEELVYGFLFSERMISDPGDVKSLILDQESAEAYVQIPGTETVKGTRTIATSGARLFQGQPPVSRVNHLAIPAGSIQPDFILETMRTFTTSSEIFMTTGGVHACRLTSTTSSLLFYDDIGRHNALDKIVGKALLEGISLTDKMIFFSGRISSEIVGKCSNAGISVIISRSAPTYGAIQAAKANDMTVVAFTRGERFNVYHGAHRIAGAPVLAF